MSNDIYRYYVYAYLRSNGTPYYIGKGCNKRAYENHNHIKVPKDRSKIVFLERNLSNIGALSLERRYIRWYGRKDLKTGILRNMTDGGEGTLGLKQHPMFGKTHSLKTRNKISLSLIGKKYSNRGSVGKGIPKSLEHRAKISAAKKGKKRGPLSPEWKAKLSASKKGRCGKNIPKSPEHRIKLQKALIEYHEKRRKDTSILPSS